MGGGGATELITRTSCPDPGAANTYSDWKMKQRTQGHKHAQQEHHFLNERLKGHSQLAHMRFRYHFMANLHITETRSILFLTKYNKTNTKDEQKHTQKQVFQ